MHWVDLERPETRVLGAILRRQAEAIPDATFLMAGEERYSFGRVDALADAYAGGLRRLGVGPGDTVAIFMHSSPEFLFATFGANRIGAIWVPTNTDYRGEWLRESLEMSRARVLIVDAPLVPRLAELRARPPFERVVVRGRAPREIGGVPAVAIAELARSAREDVEAPVHFSDTAAVLWTSGTTGRPKGVMQSHGSWVRSAAFCAENAGVREGDVLYNCLPMYNSAAWVTNVYPALIAGLPVGLDDHFSATGFWDRTRFYGATHSCTLGAMHIFLWRAPERPDDRDNPVRAAWTIPMPEPILEPFRRRFGIDVILQGYGQSELMGLFTRVDDGRRRWKPNSAGLPLPDLEVRLLDDRDVEVPVGEVGEFCVRPRRPYVLFNGYFGDPEATLASFRNLWYHSGDLGRRDESGEFFFFDRKADYIRYKGRNVSSFAVEATVNAHPAVAESAAYGVTSAELESEAEIKVDVVLEAGRQLTPEELATFVNENAPYFLVPRYIEFVDELPHTPTGRLRKFELRKRRVGAAAWDREKAGFTVRR